MKRAFVNRYRLMLTPAGAGVFSLFFPGLLIAAVARQRLLLAISIGAGLLLGANLVLARRALGRIQVDVRSPSMATVGVDSPMTVSLSGVDAPLECAVGIEGSTNTWTPAVAPTEGPILVRPRRRGVQEHTVLRIKTEVPLGLLACIRTIRPELPQPLHVAPAAVPTSITMPRSLDAAAGVRGGEPIGLRAYEPGDSQRDVHWPSVARTGTMLVRDRRSGAATTQVTVAIEPRTPGNFDDALGRARAATEQLLNAGYQVTLAIDESEQVRSGEDLIRRLATAQPPFERLSGSGPRLVIGKDGAWWQDAS